MKITGISDYIRQQHLGQFRRPGDGKGPFTHVNGQGFNSTKEQKECSVYITSEKVVTFEKDIVSNSTKFFDFDAGIKCKTEKINETSREEKTSRQDNKNGKEQVMVKEEKSIDRWA